MVCVSVTRLRLRSARFLPLFAVHALRSAGQLRRAAGFRGGATLADRDRTFWTLTTWDSLEDMRRYVRAGAHKAAMPRLMHWCDEASVVHWEEQGGMPSWQEADRRMRAEGRASKVNHPSRHHAALLYREPRFTLAGPLPPPRSR